MGKTMRLARWDYKLTHEYIRICYQNGRVLLELHIDAETDSEEIEYPVNHVNFYHNGSFEAVYQNSIYDLIGTTFVWEENEHERGDAGCIYACEHMPINRAELTIEDITDGVMTIHWKGEGDICWGGELGCDVPFDMRISDYIFTCFEVCIDALISDTVVIDKGYSITLMNFDELLAESKRTKAENSPESLNCTLYFRIDRYGEKYFGKIVFTNGIRNRELIMDEGCPLNVRLDMVTDLLDYEEPGYDFVFVISPKT